LDGSVDARDIIVIVVCPLFCSVDLIPDAVPLYFGGTLFIIDTVFGDANIPFPKSMKNIIRANKVMRLSQLLSCFSNNCNPLTPYSKLAKA
jgi:hypothetical protein